MAYSQPGTPNLVAAGHMDARRRGYSQPIPSWHRSPNLMPPSSASPYAQNFVLAGTGIDTATVPMYDQESFYPSDVRHSLHNSPAVSYPAQLAKATNMYAPEMVSSPPLPIHSTPEFTNFPPAFEGLGLDFEGQYPAPVGTSQPDMTGEAPLTSSIGSDPVPYSSTMLPPKPGYGPADAFYADELGASDVVMVGEESKQHYEICYWETVDPIFPIVHYATHVTRPPNPALRDIMCALGAQASPRATARKDSAMLSEQAANQCDNVRS